MYIVCKRIHDSLKIFLSFDNLLMLQLCMSAVIVIVMILPASSLSVILSLRVMTWEDEKEASQASHSHYDHYHRDWHHPRKSFSFSSSRLPEPLSPLV